MDVLPEQPQYPIRFAVRSLGWLPIREDELTQERSSQAVNKCIVDLSVRRKDLNDVVGLWGDVTIHLFSRLICVYETTIELKCLFSVHLFSWLFCVYKTTIDPLHFIKKIHIWFVRLVPCSTEAMWVSLTFRKYIYLFCVFNQRESICTWISTKKIWVWSIRTIWPCSTSSQSKPFVFGASDEIMQGRLAVVFRILCLKKLFLNWWLVVKSWKKLTTKLCDRN